ncbi:MAG TPA: aldehyde dehydrogenase family protein [Actinopolymorphaceae bacterium]|jgi:acyl-CoA reductase-like NAD-dependent aldehyde dehydrogenase
MSRVDVRKTYKLFIGGAFPRSESGYTYVVSDHRGGFLANAAKASRKDARDAVEAATKAQPGWANRTAYNRGQILYRIAEMLEGRREQFVTEVLAAEGGSRDDAQRQVDASIDRWVWYAGWADKLAQVLGGANAVSGPYFDFSVPEPTGVIAVVAPPGSSLLGLVSVLAPVIVSGNTAVVVTSPHLAIPAMTLAEVLATSDLPAGVVNLLTGDPVDTLPSLAAHTGVNGIDLTGVEDPDLATAWEREAAVNLKRVRRPGPVDWFGEPGLTRMTTFIETKTVWHPIGL